MLGQSCLPPIPYADGMDPQQMTKLFLPLSLMYSVQQVGVAATLYKLIPLWISIIDVGLMLVKPSNIHFR